MARNAGLIALFIVAALLGTVGGVLFAFSSDIPEVTALDSYQPHTITRLLARDGRVIGEFAIERRIVIGYNDMAPVLRQAIIATEDGDFEQHFGLSVSRIVITAFKDIVYGQRFGASTITQQLARGLFLGEYMNNGVFVRSGWPLAERKMKEMLVSVQLERRYTKAEILTLYANQINLGHGAYGVEAAARMYFDKSAKDLTLEEAATIAAIIQTPARLSPFVNPDRTLARRNNYVLPRMVEEGFITKEQAADAASRPLVLVGQPTPERSIAPYFVEDIRKVLEQKYGADALYQTGLRVQTTLDVDLQEAANAAIDRGLRVIDKRRNGFRKPARNIVAEGRSLEKVSMERWSEPILAGDIVPAVVTFVPGPSGGSARIRIGEYDARAQTLGVCVDAAHIGSAVVQGRRRDRGPGAIARRQEAERAQARTAARRRRGPDRDRQPYRSDPRHGRRLQLRPQQIQPRLAGASSGRLALQAVCLHHGDRPRLHADLHVHRRARLIRTWPQSAAIQAAQLRPQVRRPGHAAPRARTVAQHSRGEGDGGARAEGSGGLREALRIEGRLPAVPVARAGRRRSDAGRDDERVLGVPESGRAHWNRTRVMSIADREGNILLENRPEPHEALRADTAFVMTNLLRGVVQRGTAQAAAALDWPLAGKTGTMDEYTDAWFIGFDPNITVGVWVGYDEKKPLGNGETGAAAALPIWMDFMKVYLEKYGDRKNPPQFEAPGNIVFVTLDSGVSEAFINGTQPAVSATATPAPAPTPVPASAPASSPPTIE